MEKSKADFIIKRYLKPLFGFAVNKTGNMLQAEELASRIVLEVYSALLKRTNIIDVNSYIFKIAHNMWARYCEELSQGGKILSVDGLDIASDEDIDETLIYGDEYGMLRREVAFLGAQRRKIVMAYYFENRKIEQISGQMQIPVGTVKWQLFKCKKELKEGMEKIRTIGKLGLNPIRFNQMGHSGMPGLRGDTSNFLAKSLTQNVAYACYFTPHSVNEIAQELGVSPIFVEDELNELVDYGFIDKLPNGKYRTNIIIAGDPGFVGSSENVFEKFAPEMVDRYYSKLLDIRAHIEKLPVYYTDHDYNFLLWTLIMYASYRLHYPELDVVKYDEAAVHRKDGGYYIALANIGKEPFDEMQKPSDWKIACGYMTRGDGNNGKMQAIKLAVYWAGEPLQWRNNTTDDYKMLYHFLNGNLPQDERNLESYETLVSKGYLVRNDAGYYANIVYIPDPETKSSFDALMPEPDDRIRDIARMIDESIYEQQKAGQPEHMHKAIRLLNQNSIKFIHVYAMKNMLDRGMLKLPAEHQRKQICNMMYIWK